MFGFDLAIKTVLFYAHEDLWSKSKWGLSLDVREGCCIFLTGLPCSGKTTIALELKKQLEKRLHRVEYLDGDVMRKLPNWGIGFSKEDRDTNIKRIARISSYLSLRAITLCSFVSPYRKTRKFVKDCTNNFIEVHVSCPADVCAERDVKGMWAKAKSGEIKGFTGYDDPYEEPDDADITVYTHKETVDESVKKILEHLEKQDWFNS